MRAMIPVDPQSIWVIGKTTDDVILTTASYETGRGDRDRIHYTGNQMNLDEHFTTGSHPINGIIHTNLDGSTITGTHPIRGTNSGMD